MFGFLGEKLIPPINTSLSAPYYFHQKNISKKKSKRFSIFQFIPLLFAPRLRDNASDKKEVWVSG